MLIQTPLSQRQPAPTTHQLARPALTVGRVVSLGVLLITLSGCMQSDGLGERVSGWFAAERSIPLPPPTPERQEAGAPRPEPVLESTPPPPRRPSEVALTAATLTADAIVAAPLTVERILGRDQDAVRALLGMPSAARERPPAVIWAYRGTDCGVEVRFFPNLDTSLPTALSVDLVRRGSEVGDTPSATDEAALTLCLTTLQYREAVG